MSSIGHVSDTALWVATFRARESERADALFRDPLARRLVGEEGERIADSMPDGERVSWTIVVRTCIIDEFVLRAIRENQVDVVLNLGAGLDTRPYRMELPRELLWIEVDYPSLIHLKEERLKGEAPRCRLERVAMDLADRSARLKLFETVQARSRGNVLVLTEGVILYLSNESVAELAEDLAKQERFGLWVVDYWSKRFRAMMQRGAVQKKLARSPFLFDPPDWRGFFAERRWSVAELRYIAVEGRLRGRPLPLPRLVGLLARWLMPASAKKQIAELSGYALLSK